MFAKKKLIFLIAILILVITGFVFVIKYKGLISEKKKTSITGEKEQKRQSIEIKSFSTSGTVVGLESNKLTIKTNSGNIVLDMTSPPSIYMMEKEKRIDKKASDLKEGAKIQVRYLDNQSWKAPIVIFIEKL